MIVHKNCALIDKQQPSGITLMFSREFLIIRDELRTQMDIPIFDTRRGLRLTPLAAALITLVGTLALVANEPSVPPTSGTPSGSDRVLPPNVAISVNVVTRLFPEVTQEAATGQNATAVGNPKATRSIFYHISAA